MTTPLPAALDAPYSGEAEEAVLGALMVSPQMYWQVSQILTPDDFFLLRHGTVFRAIGQVMERCNQADYLLVAEELKATKKFEDVGGHAYLMQLINNTPTSTHAPIYAELVAATAARRKMLEASDQMRDLARNQEINLTEALNGAENALIALARHRETSHRFTVGESLETTGDILHQRIKLYQKNPNYVIGVCSGIQALDKHLDGFQPGITTLAASTGMGKTAAALTFALNASITGNQQGDPLPASVHLFSGEMTQTQVDFRLLAMKSGIPMERLMRGELNAQTYNQFLWAKQELNDLHALTFESGKQLNVMEIRNRTRELVNSQELDLFVIDGLMQINGLQMDMNTSKKFQRYQEQKRRDAIEYILNELEYISMTYKIPFLLTHQVNRAAAGRNDKRPQISDMAEASFVEWKSSVILFLYRDAYYNPVPDNGTGRQDAEIIISKNRHGSPGMVNCLYESKRTLFANGTLVRVDLTKDE